jgi:hypothetical protein
MSTLRGGTVVVTWSDDPVHYIAMCYRCHARLDLERGNRSNIGVRYRAQRAAERARRDQDPESHAARRDRLYTTGADGFRHLNGVAWHDEWVPSLGHSCWVQTCGRIGPDYYERCPCGAVRRNGRAWSDRNTRPRMRAGYHELRAATRARQERP